jgi:transposase
MDTADAEVYERTLNHEPDDVRAFYSQFAAGAIVGVEACGYALWFHRLVEQLGHLLRVGNSLAIRQFVRRRQKNDRRDAQLILDLLLRGDFSAVHLPSPESREVPAPVALSSSPGAHPPRAAQRPTRRGPQPSSRGG